MGVSFENGKLKIDEEIRLKIPLPIIDIPVPIVPPLPSFTFPPFPDVPTDLINLKTRFDFLDGLQGQTPSVSLESGGTLSFDPTSGGGGGGGGGISTPVVTEIPAASVDYGSLFDLIDIPIPTIPGLPSFEFPPFPDVPTDLINLKARFDFLDGLQGQTSSVSLESGGSLSFDPTSGGGGGGGGGISTPVVTEIPAASVDYDSLFDLIDIPIPVVPGLPSFTFPAFPDPTALFGDLGIDPDLYLDVENNPSSGGYNPTAPEVIVKLFINDIAIS